MGDLSRVLLEAASEPVRAALLKEPDLEGALAALVERCRTAHPSVRLEGDRFVGHLGRHLRDDDGAGAAKPLTEVHATDLWLALGCAERDAAALATFESTFVGDVDAAVSHMSLRSAQKEDVAQAVRERLLVAAPGSQPRIADYSGRGPLSGWVRVAATRTALSMLRKKDPAAAGTPADALVDAAASLDDPELEHVRVRHKGDFKAAFQAALLALTPHDRTVLRLYLVDELNIDKIGALYQVHRATVARWIARSRDTVRDETKRLLAEQLRLDGSELESLVRVVQVDLDLSMSRILRENED